MVVATPGASRDIVALGGWGGKASRGDEEHDGVAPAPVALRRPSAMRAPWGAAGSAAAAGAGPGRQPEQSHGPLV